MRHPEDSVHRGLQRRDRQPFWRTARERFVLVTPAIFEHDGRAELVTQATTFIRGYDSSNGKSSGAWAATPRSRFRRRLSPRRHRRHHGDRGVQPIYAHQARARPATSRESDQTTNSSIAWSHEARGPYIRRRSSTWSSVQSWHHGVLAAYDVGTGEASTRNALRGGGSSRVSCGRRRQAYLTSEEGDIFVVKAGSKTSCREEPMGQVIMATPAISNGSSSCGG